MPGERHTAAPVSSDPKLEMLGYCPCGRISALLWCDDRLLVATKEALQDAVKIIMLYPATAEAARTHSSPAQTGAHAVGSSQAVGTRPGQPAMLHCVVLAAATAAPKPGLPPGPALEGPRPRSAERAHNPLFNSASGRQQHVKGQSSAVPFASTLCCDDAILILNDTR